MTIRNSSLSGALFGAALLASTALPAQAQDQKPLKIGVITDLNSVYSDIGRKGNVEATKMAIEDFGGQMFGKPIEIVSADATKADVAVTFARKWWESEGVDAIIDMPTSATALAVMEISKQMEKLLIVTDAASWDCQESCVRGHSDAHGGRIWRSRRTLWTNCWPGVTRRPFFRRTGCSTN